jgi:hypothetical protein
MSELSLSDVINEAMNELESVPTDNQADGQDEDLVDLELDEVDGDPDTSEEDESESDIEEDDEQEDEESDDDIEDTDAPEAYVVKVDGEEVEVTLDELKAGYSRQAHFTKSMQALKEEREAFEAEAGNYQEVVEQLTSLDTAWESNPVSVLANLLGSTENPSYMLGLLIKEAASNDLLDADALAYFGIDEATQKAWSTETEIERLRREVREREEADQTYAQKAEAAAIEARVQEAIQGFEDQVTDIIESEELDLPTQQDRAEFKADLLRYARDNGILDLHKAYAALVYEQARAAKAAAPRREAAHAKKSATKVVSRGGAGASSVSSVKQETDLRSVIASTMKELEF